MIFRISEAKYGTPSIEIKDSRNVAGSINEGKGFIEYK
jgi:hypothetical protein